MFSLKNLVATATRPCVPWTVGTRSEYPLQAFVKKDARTRLLTHEDTDTVVYSLVEGLNSNLRVRPDNSTDEGNPPCKIHGIVADYDLPLTPTEIDAALERMTHHPNFLEHTLSGNLRLIWLFETPIDVHSYSYAIHILSKIDDLLPVDQLAGLDRGALKSPERVFTSGNAWIDFAQDRLPNSLVLGFLVKVSASFDWRSRENGPTVPPEVAAKELRKKFPRFADWPGEFVLGAQGPTFWVDDSKSPKSAIVRETGIQTFSEHAPRPFATWSELIGAEFVNEFKQEQLGSAVAEIYYDEKIYFSRLVDGSWARDNKENLVTYLKTHKGLSDRVSKGETASEIEMAVGYVHRNHRIRTAASFAFYKEGMIEFNGMTCLNTHTIKAMAPSNTSSFPWIGQFLDTLFDPQEQLPYFMSWLAHFYQSCYYRKPRSGHALFLAGGTNIGKTFLNRAIIGALVGGFAEANDYLMGNDMFNEELFDRAFWVIDDGSISTCSRSHKRFSEMVKKVVANPTFRVNGKYQKANTVPWQGRVSCTLNLDAESLRLMPDLEISIKEKIMLLKCVEKATTKFLQPDDMDSMLARELPEFARYLLDYKYPEHTLGNDPRFFVVPYHEASLMRSSNLSSQSGGFSEILSEFLKDYFGRETTAEYWEGSALSLYRQIVADGSMAGIMKRYDPQVIARQLLSLAGKHVFDISIDATEEHRRVFRIGRGTNFPHKPNGHVVPQAENSTFEKTS